MSMTAAELFEIMKDVPREAWGNLDWYCGEFVKKHTYDVVDSDVAEHAFVGSTTAWLVERGQYPTSSKCGAGDEMRYIVLGFGNKSAKGVGTSLVAALAAACKEAA